MKRLLLAIMLGLTCSFAHAEQPAPTAAPVAAPSSAIAAPAATAPLAASAGGAKAQAPPAKTLKTNRKPVCKGLALGRTVHVEITSKWVIKHQVPLNLQVRMGLMFASEFFTNLYDSTRKKLEATSREHAEQTFIAGSFHDGQTSMS